MRTSVGSVSLNQIRLQKLEDFLMKLENTTYSTATSAIDHPDGLSELVFRETSNDRLEELPAWQCGGRVLDRSLCLFALQSSILCIVIIYSLLYLTLADSSKEKSGIIAILSCSIGCLLPAPLPR